MLALLLACADPARDTARDCVPAAETCNGADDDCDGHVDENVGAPRYTDADGDGWGTDDFVLACAAEAGRAEVPGDCDDADAAENPGEAERCGGGDDDCDGTTDEHGAEGCVRWWADADGDGVGAGDDTCTCLPEGATTDGDCDDTDPDVALDCDGGPVGAADVVLAGSDAHDVAGWRLAATADGLVVASGGQVTWLLPSPAAGSAPDQAGATFEGGAWIAAGDLGGDGVGELVFARPDFEGAGEAWVTYVFTAPYTGALALADATWSWEAPEVDYLGWYDAEVADLDGDGASELLVGGPESDAEDAVRRLDAAGPTALFSGDDLGTRLCAPGDLDGDGIDDLALGAGDLAVHVFLGAADGPRTAADADATVSLAVVLLERAGDADGDGTADLLVGEAGRVWIVAGVASGAVADVAVAALGGEDEGDLAFPAAAAGDPDEDGVADLVVGDLLRGGTGAAYLVAGPFSGVRDLSQADLRLYGATEGDYLGSALAWDGATAWIGAPGVDDAANDAGAVWGVDAGRARSARLP